jgi:DNA gyrase subunit B
VLTVLHAGGKFDSQAYAVSGGLHGVGVSVVNALSKLLIAEVRRDDGLYRQSYVRGAPQGPVERVGEPADAEHVVAGSITGTTISFWPDDEIFESTEFVADTIARRLRDTAFLNAGLHITLTDERPADERDEVEDPPDAAGPGLPRPGRSARLRRPHPHHQGQGRPAPRHPLRAEEQGPNGRQSIELACSGSTTTTTRSSPSRTRSTPTRAAPTRRASAPRSPR